MYDILCCLSLASPFAQIQRVQIFIFSFKSILLMFVSGG
jgi:hypothetical protein